MLRVVVSTTVFDREIETLRSAYPSIDDVRKAVEFDLAKRPQHGERLPSSSQHWIFLTYPIGGTPIFRVLYHFDLEGDQGLVTMLSIAPAHRDFPEDS